VPSEPVLDGGPDSPTGRGILGESGVPLKAYGHSTVICVKTAEPIEIPIGLWAQIGRRNHVASRGAEGRCHGNKFLAFAGL